MVDISIALSLSLSLTHIIRSLLPLSFSLSPAYTQVVLNLAVAIGFTIAKRDSRI